MCAGQELPSWLGRSAAGCAAPARLWPCRHSAESRRLPRWACRRGPAALPSMRARHVVAACHRPCRVSGWLSACAAAGRQSRAWPRAAWAAHAALGAGAMLAVSSTPAAARVPSSPASPMHPPASLLEPAAAHPRPGAACAGGRSASTFGRAPSINVYRIVFLRSRTLWWPGHSQRLQLCPSWTWRCTTPIRSEFTMALNRGDFLFFSVLGSGGMGTSLYLQS